jgi:glycine/D-amino acid oxidase-like deaminating enzyme
MTTTSYWIANADDIEWPARIAGDATTDVAIVGGGIAGWSVAYWLRQRGLDAIVIDRDAVPHGASARNAGFLLSGSASSYSDSVRRDGHAAARDEEQLSRDNRDGLVERILAHHDCHFDASGSWRLAESEQEEQELRDSLALLRADGFSEYEWVDASDARGELKSPRFFGGLLQPRDGMLHPLRLVAAIARESRARFIGGEPVLAVDEIGEGTRIRTASSSVTAARAVVTLNAYTQQLLPEFAVRIRPVRAQALVTEPMPERHWSRPIYSHYGFFYFRQLRDGSLLLGGARHLHEHDEVGFDDTTTPALQRSLDEYLSSLAIPQCAIRHRWSGTMGFTESHHPIASEVRRGVHVLGGFNGHGIGMAFECARRLVAQF